MWLGWWVACNDPVPSASDPAEPGVLTTPVEGCSPEITVPASFGELDPTVVAEPHRDVFGPAPEPFQIRYGWPGSDPSQSASFLWRTDLDTLATVVELGTDGALDLRVQGASFRFGATATQVGAYRIHEVKICSGLQPGTTYTYRVGSDGHWSPTHTFTTPGAPGTFDTFRVGIAGDSRGTWETWGTVVSLIDSHDPDFILFTGDMIDFGTLQTEWDAWFEATGDILAETALIPAHGNHEFLAAHYFAQFSLPNNEQWYNIRYGDLELAVLNDTVSDRDDIVVKQAAFLEDVFGASDAPWKVAAHHQALYSTSGTHGSNLVARAAWAPVFDAHGVQAVFAGHNHVYERSVPIRADAEVPPGKGTVYVVSGGAGAPLYTSFEEAWFSAVANPVEHYVIADFGPTSAELVVRDLAGNVIDTFVIPR